MKQSQSKKLTVSQKVANIKDALQKVLDEQNKYEGIPSKVDERKINGHEQLEVFTKNIAVYYDLCMRLDNSVNRLVKLSPSNTESIKEQPVLLCFADVLVDNNNSFSICNNRLERILASLESFI